MAVLELNGIPRTVRAAAAAAAELDRYMRKAARAGSMAAAAATTHQARKASSSSPIRRPLEAVEFRVTLAHPSARNAGDI
jgi:hypothetical protein